MLITATAVLLNALGLQTYAPRYPLNEGRGFNLSQANELDVLAIVRPLHMIASETRQLAGPDQKAGDLVVTIEEMEVVDSPSVATGTILRVVTRTLRGVPTDRRSAKTYLLIGRSAKADSLEIPEFVAMSSEGSLPAPQFLRVATSAEREVFGFGLLPTNAQAVSRVTDPGAQLLESLLDGMVGASDSELVQLDIALKAVDHSFLKDGVMSSDDPIAQRIWTIAESASPKERARLLGMLVTRKVSGSVKPFLRALLAAPDAYSRPGESIAELDLSFDAASKSGEPGLGSDLQALIGQVAEATTSAGVLGLGLRYLGAVDDARLKTIAARWLQMSDRQAAVWMVNWLAGRLSPRGMTVDDPINTPNLQEAISYWRERLQIS